MSLNFAPDRPSRISFSQRLKAHVAISRIDHWTKNVFVLPGVVVPLTVLHAIPPNFFYRLVVGLISVCLIASSNYVINEILDAPFDAQHPTKRNRPAAVGLVHLPAGYLQWLMLMVVGMLLAFSISNAFAASMFILWAMGCAYNIRPLRTKDLPYVDVLSEAVNNPLRMLAGWYIVTNDLIPPVSLLSSYWMVGCYFMALKRFSEFRQIGNPVEAAAYRRSFAHYSERSLIVSVMFYASAGMLFFGAFLVRYRMELVLAFPLIALVMSIYCNLAFEHDSPVQNPELLYRQKGLMLAVVSCSAALLLLLWVDVPILRTLFAPTLPG